MSEPVPCSLSGLSKMKDVQGFTHCLGLVPQAPSRLCQPPVSPSDHALAGGSHVSLSGLINPCLFCKARLMSPHLVSFPSDACWDFATETRCKSLTLFQTLLGDLSYVVLMTNVLVSLHQSLRLVSLVLDSVWSGTIFICRVNVRANALNFMPEKRIVTCNVRHTGTHGSDTNDAFWCVTHTHYLFIYYLCYYCHHSTYKHYHSSTHHSTHYHSIHYHSTYYHSSTHTP